MSNEAPGYIIQINDKVLDIGVSQFVLSVEYESADGVADVAKVVLMNPDFILTDKKFIQPGNEMSIYFGYDSLEFIGRVKIAKKRKKWPAAGDMPTSEIVGY